MFLDKKSPFSSMIDPEAGTVDRMIFSDQDIYDLEMERIFARGWNFMCHESQIPNPGDFFLNYIGEESVIATRDKKGGLQVLLNSCRHRGNAVCRAEQGTARSFMCPYHGWTYDLQGKLVGLPGYKQFYKEKLDKAEWGLVSAAKVESYRGFVFATMDSDAPDLGEFLGPVGRLSIDLVAERGELQAVSGVQKFTLDCNWKLAVDNVWDWYHGDTSHASVLMLDVVTNPGQEKGQSFMNIMHQRTVLGEYGHAIGGDQVKAETWESLKNPDEKNPMNDYRYRKNPDVSKVIGEAGMDIAGHPHIFPNLWFAVDGMQLSLRLPRGPQKTEIWWFTLIPEGVSEERRKAILHHANHMFGPAGMLEQEDGENWSQSTRNTRGPIARKYPLNYQMGLGEGRVVTPEDGSPPYIDTPLNENPQRWLYRNWADWMNAESWKDLRKNHSPVPDAVV